MLGVFGKGLAIPPGGCTISPLPELHYELGHPMSNASKAGGAHRPQGEVSDGYPGVCWASEGIH